MTRSMLQGKNLAKNYYAKAINTAIYIVNRSTTRDVLNKTPYEGWCNKKLKAEHFEIFGCIAYSHISNENMEQLYRKGERYILLVIVKNAKDIVSTT